MDSNTNKVMHTPDAQYIKKEKREHIQVFLRARPLNSHEKSKGALAVVDCPGQKEVVVRGPGNVYKTFTFDRVFGPLSKQLDVYKAVVTPQIDEVLLGYNCTVFAYGQTGTGKTFTMEGERTDGSKTWESDPLAGIVPRAMSHLFDELRVKHSEFTVRVSLVEMYNEEVYDLLSPTEDSKLKTVRLFEDPSRKGSVHIQGLEEVIVHNKHEVYAIMERGSQMRKTASTLLNANSSRSHTVFTVTVHMKESNGMGEDLVKIGKLNLVDLAGSENIGRSGAVDKRAREAGNINQSLLTLGRVITALVERTPHIPYRESKLTRLLQDSLGGKTKTSIIATISPASINIEETLSTLDYAHRAKNIQNRPEVNQKLTKKAMLKEYTEEIERLRKDLMASREKNGIYVDKENYDRMMSQIESQDQDLSEKIQFTKNLEEQLKQKEDEIAELTSVLEEAKDDLETANQVIHGKTQRISELVQKLGDLEMKKDEMEHLVQVHSETENKLTVEAKSLLITAAETTDNLEVLYNRLERKKNVEAANYEAGKRFRADFDQELKVIAKSATELREQHSKFSGEHRMQLDYNLNKKEMMIAQMQEKMNAQSAQFRAMIEALMKAHNKQMEENGQWMAQMEEMDQEQTSKAKDELYDHCNFISNSTDDFKQNLHMQSGKLNEFWDSTYLIDLPTGATPQRKAYDFPRHLSATSPHARILNRFRAGRFPAIQSESEPGSSNDGSCRSSFDGQNNLPSTVEEEEASIDENRDPVDMFKEFDDASSQNSSSVSATSSAESKKNASTMQNKSDGGGGTEQRKNYDNKYMKNTKGKKVLTSSN